MILILVSFVSPASFAGGALFSNNCPDTEDVQAPAGSQGFFMSADCRTVWVLPPVKGTVEVTGRTVGNIQRCQEVLAVNRTLGEVNKNIQKAVEGRGDAAKLAEAVAARKSILEAFSDLSHMQAASVELNFSMAIEENVRRFQDYNQGSNLRFAPVPLKKVKLQWNKSQTQDPEMPIAFNPDVPLSDLNNIGSGSFSARLDLSLFGACPLRDGFTHALPRKIRARDLAGIITPNVTYSYEVGANYSYKATFNRGALARKIRSASSSGGFFRTSTASTLTETAESSGWFKFEMSCEDSRVCDQAKTETALQIKQRLIQEVFDNISLARLGYAVTPLEAGTPGKNGAAASADALRKCPHAYCQAGAIVLDIAGAVFGGTSKTDSYISKNDHTDIEEVTELRPVEFLGTMGFGQ